MFSAYRSYLKSSTIKKRRYHSKEETTNVARHSDDDDDEEELRNIRNAVRRGGLNYNDDDLLKEDEDNY